MGQISINDYIISLKCEIDKNFRRFKLGVDGDDGRKRNDLEIVVPHIPKTPRLIDGNSMIMGIEIGAAAVDGAAFHPLPFLGRICAYCWAAPYPATALIES